jgi:hypothetical protein
MVHLGCGKATPRCRATGAPARDVVARGGGRRRIAWIGRGGRSSARRGTAPWRNEWGCPAGARCARVERIVGAHWARTSGDLAGTRFRMDSIERWSATLGEVDSDRFGARRTTSLSGRRSGPTSRRHAKENAVNTSAAAPRNARRRDNTRGAAGPRAARTVCAGQEGRTRPPSSTLCSVRLRFQARSNLREDAIPPASSAEVDNVREIRRSGRRWLAAAGPVSPLSYAHLKGGTIRRDNADETHPLSRCARGGSPARCAARSTLAFPRSPIRRMRTRTDARHRRVILADSGCEDHARSSSILLCRRRVYPEGVTETSPRLASGCGGYKSRTIAATRPR